MSLYYSEPLSIEVKGRSVFVNQEAWEFSVRNISQMNDVLMEKQNPKRDFPAYFMFRDITKNNGIRYDITLIPPKKFGNELAKTYGHYHPYAIDRLAYPEVYQVLDGKALFILQKKRSDETVDVIITYGLKGQVVLIPPNYGHVSINASTTEKLVMANLVADGFESLYDEYKQNRGAAYYVTEDGLEPNMRYIVRGVDKKKPEEISKQYGLHFLDLLKEFSNNPKKFEFLKKPELIVKLR
ncbi:glucose-6-phosphate isomerase [Candidatus Micrarchaeota archaeon]|nr:glucose-6-phosphate isomerase [Candidatus Micrarchaeota archaeon]